MPDRMSGFPYRGQTEAHLVSVGIITARVGDFSSNSALDHIMYVVVSVVVVFLMYLKFE